MSLIAALGISQLALFIVAGLLLNLTPGVDVLYIVSSSMRHGTRAGLVAALGIGAGCGVHIAAASLGLSALVTASASAFTVLKWLGAAYLVWVGAQMLWQRGTRNASENIAVNPDAATLSATFSLKKVFLQGFWTNVLNPKVALFFLAFLPQFIAHDAAHPGAAFLLLGLIFNVNGLWVNAGWALLAAWAARRVGALQRGMTGLQRVAGALFVGFGLKLAFTAAPTA